MLGVLDGAVLVISAVEGVQAQTRVLMRALRRLRIPTLIFVNKIDRAGARTGQVLAGIAERLTPSIVAMGSVTGLGTARCAFRPYGPGDAAFTARLAELLAEHDEALLADYVRDETGLSYRRLSRALAAQTRQGLVHPVFFGSAITGAGVAELTAGLTRFLPATHGDAAGPVSGTVFKVERGPAGEKIAYVRMFSGALHVRDRLPPAGRPEDHRDQRVRARPGGPARAGPRRADRQALGAARHPDRRHARRAARGAPAAPVRPAHAGDRGDAPPPRGQGRAAHRAHPARRAGPADRPAPRRRPRRAAALALRRGAEGGHPGHAGQRVRRRRRVSATPRRSASSGPRGPARRSRSSTRRRTRSWPRSGCGSNRRRWTPGSGSGWRSSSGRCRSRSSRRSRRPWPRRCGRGCTAGR